MEKLKERITNIIICAVKNLFRIHLISRFVHIF